MPQLHRALLRCFSGRTSHLIRPYRPAIWGCAGPGPVCQLPALQPPLAGKLRGTPPTAARRAPATVRVGGGGSLSSLKTKKNKTTRKPNFLENNLEEGLFCQRYQCFYTAQLNLCAAFPKTFRNEFCFTSVPGWKVFQSCDLSYRVLLAFVWLSPL